MKPKLLLGLALVLCGGLILSRATETNTMAVTNLSAVEFVSPQISVDLPKLGPAFFREQSSDLSLQVPIGFKKKGEQLTASDSNTLDLQVWLLKTDGTSIPQVNKPSVISFGNFGGNSSTDYMFYMFQKVPVDEVAGVVIRMNGKLYCHEIGTAGQTSPVPLYLHYGFVGNDSAHRFLSARIHLDEAIFVGGDDYLELTGRIERRGTNLVADLLGGTGPQSQFYQGNMTLEKPVFAQGGAASGGAGPPFWFVISTNWDCRAVLNGVNASMGLTGAPFDHTPTVYNSPGAATNLKQIGPRTNNIFVDPTTGLPLPPKRDKQP